MEQEIANLNEKIKETEDEIKSVKADLKKAKEENQPTDLLISYLTALRTDLTALLNKEERLFAASRPPTGKYLYLLLILVFEHQEKGTDSFIIANFYRKSCFSSKFGR